MPRFSEKLGGHVSAPEIKLLLLILFALGALASISKSEPVLPAYLLGMVLATFFAKERGLAQRLRTITFALLTPFYFLKAGSLVKFEAIAASLGLIAILLAMKMATKFLGILPLTRAFDFDRREGMYTTLMMSTGLTFGTISALFGLTNGIIDQEQYTILVTAVIASAVDPDPDRPALVPADVQADCHGGQPMFRKMLIANDGSEGAFKALDAALAVSLARIRRNCT